MKQKSFEELLLEAVDDTLSSLGDSAKQAIYFHLEDKFKITKNDIPHRLEDFTHGIEKIFGLGAQFIEISIMRQLHEKVGLPLKWNKNKELVFVEYVETAKQSFSKTKKGAKAVKAVEV